MNQKYSIIGYASEAGSYIVGCEKGPQVLRVRKLIDAIKLLGHEVEDLGDINANITATEEEAVISKLDSRETKVKNISQVYHACKRLHDKTTQALNQGRIPLLLGGDHSLSVGSIAALSNFYAKKQQKIGLIWIDTHPDINLPETSPSLHVFGMVVAVLLGLIPGKLSSLQESLPAIDPKHLVYIGLRDVDPGERELIKKHNISSFTMKEIDIYGLAKVMEQAIAIASNGTAGYAVSFDLDVCDPQLVPGTGTPKRGGLTFRESHLACEMLSDAGGMLALEMVELNPMLDKDFQTADLAISLIESALGKTIF